MIDKEKWKERIKRFNNYVLCFVLFYVGVSISSFFNMLRFSKEEVKLEEWDIEQKIEDMKNMY